jgi:hypothetical protein
MLGGLGDNRQIGIGLTALGLFFLLLGCLMLFDAVLLAFGNVLFVTGTTLVIGPSNTLRLFMRKHKIRGTICFILGVFLVLMRWPITGILIEAFGIINLFGNFFPIIISFLKRLPVVGPVLEHPVIANCLDRVLGGTLPLYSTDASKGN